MNNLIIVIIDDEPRAREGLKAYINRLFPESRFEFHLCNSVKEGVSVIETYLPDLVFLDIEMPEANGFELFHQVNQNSFEVVFVTAYSEFIEKSVNEIGCFGYLLKPPAKDQLKRIFERYQEKGVDKKHLKFVNSVQNKRTIVALNDILFCKADDNYCEIYMNDGKNRYILSRTLSRLEASLPAEFFQRVHRSFIVNMNHVLHFEKIKKQVVINHSNENWTQNIPVSASYIEKIREMFL